MTQKNDSREVFLRWKRRVQSEFGPASAEAIVRSLLEECGGQRISLPDLQDLMRESRDHMIRNRFEVIAREVGSGEAYRQLAINFELSSIQIRRIVNGTCGKKENVN